MEIETLINIGSFIGAWLLFLGPMQQAVLELREEDEARERLHAVHKKVPEPQQASSWWWLVPPVKLFLENRIRNDYKRAVTSLLSPEDMAILMTYLSKARAWMFVGLGGLLIAIKETFELFYSLKWSHVVFLVTVIVLALVCLGNVVRTAQSQVR